MGRGSGSLAMAVLYLLKIAAGTVRKLAGAS